MIKINETTITDEVLKAVNFLQCENTADSYIIYLNEVTDFMVEITDKASVDEHRVIQLMQKINYIKGTLRAFATVLK